MLEKKVEKKKIFVLCPVRGVSPEEKEFIENYVSQLEAQGHEVYYPHRDTNQADSIGLRICRDNRTGIYDSDEVHAFWNCQSKGSLFDFGMAFMAEKPIVLINRDYVKPTPEKSFENVLLALDSESRDK